jgi:hypothetical protein
MASSVDADEYKKARSELEKYMLTEIFPTTTMSDPHYFPPHITDLFFRFLERGKGDTSVILGFASCLEGKDSTGSLFSATIAAARRRAAAIGATIKNWMSRFVSNHRDDVSYAIMVANQPVMETE